MALFPPGGTCGAFLKKNMSWPITPPITPKNLRTLIAPGRLIVAGVGARAAGNVLSLPGRTNLYRQVMRKSLTQTKTKSMPRVYKKPATKKLATVAAVKRMIGAVAEKKQQALGVGPTAFTLVNSGVPYSYNVTAQLIQGTADSNRIGDTIFLESFHFNATIISAAAGSYYRYRVLVGWSGEELTPAGFTTAGLSAAQIFINSGFDATNMVVNPKAFTVLHDEIVEINSQIAAVNDGATVRVNLYKGIRGKFNYQAAGSTYGKIRNLFVVFIPQSGGVTPLDLGTMNINMVTKFTDS